MPAPPVQSERDSLTELVIGPAIEIHRALGPGLLESAYQECLCYELKANGIAFGRQVALSGRLQVGGIALRLRMDLVVDDRLVVELKTVEKILPIHEAQLLTCLRLSGIRTGLLLNFNTAVLKNGIKRMVL